MLQFDPFRELDRISQESRRRSGQSVLAFDAVRDEDVVTVYFDVPGVTADDLDVSVERNEVIITAERRWDDEGKQVLASERPQGTFTRRLMVSDALDTNRLEADLDHGVLKLSIPVAERSKPRKIDIQSGSAGDSTIDVSESTGSSNDD